MQPSPDPAAPPPDAAFLDGYLFRVLQEAALGEEGLHDYYRARLERRTGALEEYEAAVAEYVLRCFPPDRPILHVGIGAGSTTCLLAAQGRQVTGVEADRARVALAQRLRIAVAATWPGTGARYRLLTGLFPAAVPAGLEGAVLLFTNFVSTMAAEDAVLDGLPRFRDVVLDLRLFGQVRDGAAERDALLARLAARGFAPVAAVPAPDAYYRHLARRG